MPTTVLVVGFIMIAVLVVGGFALLWRQDASRADGIAENTDRLDVQPVEEPNRHE